jgi:anti-anti-sigma regulatory factor
VVFELFEEHDLTTAVEVRGAMFGLLDEHDRVVVDLISTEFLDSSILSSLVAAHTRAVSRGRTLMVRVGQNPLSGRFRIMNLGHLLETAHLDADADKFDTV